MSRRRVSVQLALLLMVGSAGVLLSQTGGYGFSQLLSLRGAYCSVLYAPGSLDRAAHVQERLDALTLQFRDWSKNPPRLSAYVLNRDDWEKGEMPRSFGLPAMGMGVTLLLPARGDQGTVDLWRGLIKGPLPAPPGLPMVGTPQEAGSVMLADLIAVPELMRPLLPQIGIAAPEPWVAHTVAHLASYLYAVRREKTLIPQMDSFYFHIGQGPALKLEDFRSEMPVEQLLWYEARFYEAAKIIYEKDKRWSLKKLRSLQKKGGGYLTAGDLLGRYDGLTPWHTQLFLHPHPQVAPASGEVPSGF